METYTGRQFFFADPRPEDFDIEDIAWALAHIPRFTGHTRKPSNVAQHCLFVAKMSPDEVFLEALMHDAAEAYLGDVSRPLKSLLPDYQALEARVEAVLAERFELVYPWPATVKHWDSVSIPIERQLLMGPSRHDWSMPVAVEDSARAHFDAWEQYSPKNAFGAYLEAFEEWKR